MSNKYDYDLFDNPMVRSAEQAMRPEDKERYRVLGEHLFGSIDFVNSTNLDTLVVDSVTDICIQLRSGMHPSMLNKEEKNIMLTNFGDRWYEKWGYNEKDLNEISSDKFSS